MLINIRKITEDDDKIELIFITLQYLLQRSVKFVQHKTLVPNYDVFDEMRYFDSAKEVSVYNLKVKS
jgi:NAD+ synthase (glutamine-hydrolysing)